MHTDETWVFEPHNGYGSKDPDGEPWPFGYISEVGARAGLPNPIFELRPIFVEPVEKLTDAALKMAAAPAMLEALKAAHAFIDKLAGAVCGNEQFPDSETAQFYKGYNAVTRRIRTEAWELLPMTRAAISRATPETAAPDVE